MNITILGTGAYGIALSLMFNKNNCNITMWTRNEEEKQILDTERCNKKVLPEVTIPENIKFTSNLEEAINSSKLIVIAVPAGAVDEVCEQMKEYINADKHICIASKGIERDSCLFVYDIVYDKLKSEKIAVISGPSFAVDIVTMCPIGLSLAVTDTETENVIKESLENDSLKLRTTSDIVGVEICGSIKNIIAIAAGMLSGLDYPESTQAMFLTESLNDIKELIAALGGDKNTILSFAGFGDLVLTATCEKSRNFSYGKLIGLKKELEEINNYTSNTTIEGLYTLDSIYTLLKNRKVDIPIIDLIYDIIYKNEDPEELASFLIKKR